MWKNCRRTGGRSESMPATIRMRLSLSETRARELKSREEAAGFGQLNHYLSFDPQVEATKRKLLVIPHFCQGRKGSGLSATALRQRAIHCSTIAACERISSTTP